MVTITVDSSCTITGASLDQVAQIKTGLTLVNPAFSDAVKQGRYSRNIDKHLRYYSETDAGLVVPRGFMGQLCRMLDTKTWVDNRRVLPDIDFKFTGQLRDYQQKAVDDFDNRDFSVLECPTGGGKTIVALSLIRKRKQSALVIVPTVDLMHQWADRAVQFLDGEQVGKVGGGVNGRPYGAIPGSP